MNAPDLKPCDRCGQPVTIKRGQAMGVFACEAPSACDDAGLLFGFHLDREAEAIAAWNTRAPLAEAVAVPEVAALVEAAKGRLHWLDEATGEYCGCGACEPLYSALAALRAIGEPPNDRG